jgi:hypothetical protein
MPSPDRHFANAAIFTHSTGLTPNSGDAALYIKSDNKAYIKDSAGAEVIVGGTGTIAGTLGTVDNAVPRADGTGGVTAQSSSISISDLSTTNDTTVSIGPDRTSFSITGDAGTDVITATGHNFVTNQAVSFPTLTGGSGVNFFTRYFVRDVVAGTSFKVSTTIGGGAVDFTTNITAGTVISAASLVLTQGSQYGLESIATAAQTTPQLVVIVAVEVL